MKRQILNPKRVYYGMVFLLVLTVSLGIGSLVYANSFLQKKSDKLIELKLQYKIPEANQTALKRAKADIEKYSELKKIAKTIVPQQKDQAQAVLEIVNYANETVDPTTKNSIRLASITFPSSNLGQAKPKVAADSTSPAQVVTTPPVTQVQPVPGISGLYVLPITIQSDPAVPLTFNQVTAFLTKLEQNRRTAQVSTISITPQKDSLTNRSGLSFNLTVNVYIKP